jgi:CheY-like chemotaxis protein
MSNKVLHDRKILLVEDLEQFYEPISRWLRESNYHVTLAKSRHEALNALDSDHYHLAILDIRLDDEDDQNEDGLLILQEIGDRNFHNDFPCIVLTAYASVDNLMKATQAHRVDRYIQKKPGYRSDLLNAVDELFEKVVQINFGLELLGNIDRSMSEVVANVTWSNSARPKTMLLDSQARDLLGKLFRRAERIFITSLNPGFSGAVVLQVRPTWENGVGPPRIVKLGRHTKVMNEATNYDRFVDPYLSERTVRLVDTVYSQDLGALLYTFAKENHETLREFDKYYAEESAQKIVESIKSLIHDACRYWYKDRRSTYERIPDLYYESFQLDERYLISRIQEVLPGFDPLQDIFQMDRVKHTLTNPIAWLRENQSNCVQEVFKSITHGDLTGRNIMVNKRGTCWLIDFYRTYHSHILRDFVILETDIKYRLLEHPNWRDFYTLEKFLLQEELSHSSALDPKVPDDVRKAIEVLIGLRETAREISTAPGAKPEDIQKEYLISLLMATLNVVRLRHIKEGRKLNAMLSASLICSELDRLFGQS